MCVLDANPNKSILNYWIYLKTLSLHALDSDSLLGQYLALL